MPRLSKIRIVGAKYDSFKKQHENSIYNLTKGEEPDHTLFTLKNSGGKGVMMQLIFQIMLPGTRWGKNDGNKVTSMFYDQRNRLIPYSFHVILEWKLDTVPEKHLIAGICMKAYKRNSSKEDDNEEKAGLNYFLYTHEYGEERYFSVENIPAYIDGASVDYEDFEKFINDNNKFFVKYTQSSTKRLDSQYYEYMKSYGIYRSEWKILKQINKIEGGIGEYFAKANDNKAIFDELILPAISQNMKNYTVGDEGSLKDMFKSHLSITKNLPRLLDRESDYRELLSLIAPLIEDIDKGIRWSNMMSRCIVDGNNLYANFINKQKLINKNIDTWKKEEKKSEERKNQLDYELDNLEYAKANRDIISLNEEVEKAKGELDKTKENIDIINKERNLYEINELFIEQKQCTSQIKVKEEEKNRLIRALDIKDIEKRADELNLKIKEEWTHVKTKWEKNINIYHSFEKYLNTEIENNKTNKKKLDELRNGLEKEINKFEIEKKRLNNKYDELCVVFNPLRMAVVDTLLEELKEQYGKENTKLNNMENVNDKLENEINKLKINKKGIEGDLKRAVEDKASIQEKLSEVEKIEDDLKGKIALELNLDPLKEVFTLHWVHEKLNKLQDIFIEKQKRLIDTHKRLWENKIDTTLVNDRYWIPNKDVLTLKEMISSIGISVETGPQYLSSIKDKEEREKILLRYPLFIYGLVILNQGDWESIEKGLNQDILFRSPVPVYIRSEMRKDQITSFRIAKNQGYFLSIKKDKLMEWTKKIVQEGDNISISIEKIEESKKRINRLMEDIRHWQKIDSSDILREKINNISEEIDSLREDKINISQSIEKKEEELRKGKEAIKKLGKSLELLENDISALEEYIKERELLSKEEIIINEKREKLKGILDKILDIEDKIEEIRDKKSENHINYSSWENVKEEKIKRIRKIIPNAKIEIPIEEYEECILMPVYQFYDEELFSDITERESLDKKIQERNSDIILIDKDIEQLNDKNVEIERKLCKIDEQWESYEVIDLSSGEIGIRLVKLNKYIENIKIKYHEIKEEITGKKAVLKEKKNNFSNMEKKIYDRHKKAAQLWQDIDLDNKKYQLDKDMKENKNYIIEVKDIISKLNQDKINMMEYIGELKIYEKLDPLKGKTDELQMKRLDDDPRKELDEWISRYKKIEMNIKDTMAASKRDIDVFQEGIKSSVKDEILKSRILKELEGIRIEKFKSNMESFQSMQNHFQKEINSIAGDKEKAEQARQQWAVRASKHALKIIESLKEMVSRMVYINENGYPFPLVKLKGGEKLPNSEEEILFLLKEYFVDTIKRLLSKNENIDDIEDRELEKLMGDNAIFSKAVQGRYPVLMVYKMTEKNEFRYAKPRDYYYSTWEAINKGEGDLPEGSGGQTLSISTFVIMMLMNYKKRHVGNENPWTVLMLDNPFGKASAKHILDPVFEIANKLNFQLIAFAAPEIIKVEISERFPVFWALDILGIEDDGVGKVRGRVIHGGRKNMI